MNLLQLRRAAGISFALCCSLLIGSLLISILTGRQVDPIPIEEDLSHWLFDYLGFMTTMVILLAYYFAQRPKGNARYRLVIGFVGGFALAWSILLPELNEQIYGERFNDANSIAAAYLGISFILAAILGKNSDFAAEAGLEAKLRETQSEILADQEHFASEDMKTPRT